MTGFIYHISPIEALTYSLAGSIRTRQAETFHKLWTVMMTAIKQALAVVDLINTRNRFP